MTSKIVSMLILALIYACLAIIVFAPTIFAVWFYAVGRRLSPGKTRIPVALVTVFLVNLVVAFFVGKLAFDVFVTRSLSQHNARAEQTMRNAIRSQEEFHARHGRYYSVGPIRGPYTNEHGLAIEKDVILQVRPLWEESGGKDDSFEAYAVHVWGREVYLNTKEGDIEKEPFDSHKAKNIRSKLMRSVK
ncbi:MAG: hypothetical protein AB1646_01515 [Thermodesulfobacteriota bacterium]